MQQVPDAAPEVAGTEHWTRKGDVKLFLWRKSPPAGTKLPGYDPDGLKSVAMGAAGSSLALDRAASFGKADVEEFTDRIAKNALAVADRLGADVFVGSRVFQNGADVHAALVRVAQGPSAAASQENLRPAVPVKKSVAHDYIVCLEDGKKFKSLKRHLRTQYNMSPEDYREKWGLPPDYPMVAPNYAQARSQLAKEMGLGSQRRRARR